jgi:hypothetical protein
MRPTVVWKTRENSRLSSQLDSGDDGSRPHLIHRVLDWAEEGHRHGIPTCCGIRFGIDWERPKVGWFLSQRSVRIWVRLHSLLLTPRHAFATWDQQGYVPCEYHLLRWILTGRRPNIKQD